MNLIVDNGGTKALWTVAEREVIREQFTTPGIYPFHATDEDLLAYFETAKARINNPFSKVFYYSTGCSLAEQRERLVKLIHNSSLSANTVEVNTDILAAARALCGHDPGIACILGTGSNSCLYDGRAVVKNQGGLGYILGDEGSGAAMGKELLKSYLDETLPQEIREAFDARFHLTTGKILEQVYRKPEANKYLATFAPFIREHRQHLFLHQLLLNQFTNFFLKYVLVYPNFYQFSVRFLGSIARYFADELKEAARQFGIAIDQFSTDPMPGLVLYHRD